jgi:RND family efflux transporter MFP subunit
MRVLSSTLALLLLAGSALTSCNTSGGGEQERRMVIPAVEAIQARIGSLPLEERLSGTVVADNQVEIYSEISGVVEQVMVRNGDTVQRGQALLRVRDTELRERLKQAEAGLQIAEARAEQAEASLTQLQAQFDRAKALAERNMSSQAEIDNITADLASAQANLSLANAQVVQARSSVDEANLNLSRTVIRSPVSGLVGQRGIEPGQLISANTRLFIVGDPNNLRITTVLTERMITYIREGMKVTVSNPSTPDSVIDATISRISPFLDPVTHTTTAEIDIKNTGDFLLPGMFATVDVFYGQSQSATLVPNSAIYRHPLTGIEGVYIARSIGSEIQPVTDVDATAPPPLTDVTPVEFVEINVLAKGREVSGVTGIQGGAWIVTVGQNLLAGGAKEARVRTVAWDRILELQLLTEEDLLRSVMRENADRAATAANTSM